MKTASFALQWLRRWQRRWEGDGEVEAAQCCRNNQNTVFRECLDLPNAFASLQSVGIVSSTERRIARDASNKTPTETKNVDICNYPVNCRQWKLRWFSFALIRKVAGSWSWRLECGERNYLLNEDESAETPHVIFRWLQEPLCGDDDGERAWESNSRRWI